LPVPFGKDMAPPRIIPAPASQSDPDFMGISAFSPSGRDAVLRSPPGCLAGDVEAIC